MDYILFDCPKTWNDLLPLTYTRPISDLRVGITKIKEKWEAELERKTSVLTQDYLQVKFPVEITNPDDAIFINASILPYHDMACVIQKLEFGEILTDNDNIVAFRASYETAKNILEKHDTDGMDELQAALKYDKINFPWDLFLLNGKVLKDDFNHLTVGRKSEPISETNRVLNAKHIFIEKGARVEMANLNAEEGPIYIGKDAEIMENATIRGPFAILEHGAVKMSAKIYGPTTIGPYSKVGGELNNVVIQGYSSKAHDGFLGNAVLGEWCNLGADTNNSNLKNNYAPVKMWNYTAERFLQTGLQFCGLVMGDHSKCGINTMFNTGTVVGVSANIFGSGFPRNFIPSYSWGGASGFTEYNLKKVFEVADIVMHRRDLSLTDADKSILTEVFERTRKYRK
jgi:UDP-N-acetylglucosamine diphosphorylase/glucosamine-1-phosphate N-acetyltransferase